MIFQSDGIRQPEASLNAILFRRHMRGDAGATIVEFAVASSVLFLMLFGIIQCCLALYTYNYVSDAARVGTRYAAVRGSSCSGMPDCGATGTQIQTYLRGIPYPGISASKLTASAAWLRASTTPPTTWTACGSQCNAPGNAVQVTVTYAFPLNIPFWKNATVNMSSASQTVISN
jgi:Flp pilus assembly protein TadG